MAVVEQDLFGLPGGTYSFANRRRSRSYGGQEASAHRLVVGLGLCAGGVPFLVEPVQVRVVVWGFEDLEVALGGVVAFGAVDDGLAGGVPSDFLKGGVFAKATTPKEGMAEQICGQALTTGDLVGGDALFNGHAVEAAVGGEESVGSEEVEVGVENEVVVPTMVNDLPKGRGAGTTGLVDGGHK